MDFEKELLKTMRQKILKDVSQIQIFAIDYHQRQSFPQEILDKLWSSINWNEVIEQVRPTIQTRICNTIIGSMETELKTDIKRLLAIEGVRQKLRVEIYPKLMKILNGESGK